MKNIISREIRLKSRPVGIPKESDFEMVEVPVPDLGENQLLVKNLYMSVDPYMRGRMTDLRSYIPPFEIGQTLEGGSVGEVLESNNDQFKPGDIVVSFLGWREHFVSGGADLTKIDPGNVPVQAYLGTLGMPGLTAYCGLIEIGKPAKGETVFVSAASGAVGSIVSQIAKIKGCRVVGSAGSDEKVTWLKEEAGADEAFNYKTAGDLVETVGRLNPGGIDVYYENVGGRHLEAALEHMNTYGRLVMCGMIDQYNATEPPVGPTNLGYVISKQLRMQGFIVMDYMDRMPQFYANMGKWITEGKIKWKETVMESIEKAPAAFIGLFEGKNFGKMIVKL
jgi:NADPH-dependent curcumin reductase CurA